MFRNNAGSILAEVLGFQGVSASNGETGGPVAHTRTQEETASLGNQLPFLSFFYQALSPRVKGPLGKTKGMFYQI